MEDKTHKCSSVEHSKIDAIIFCQACNVFYCNKCQNNFHSKIFPNHPIKNLNKVKIDIFTNICNENNHLCKYEYFCKTHNKLCCVKCIAKIKDENNGQHKDCDISSLKEIKIEKEKKFEDNYNKLKEISNNLEKTINQFKVLIEQINKNKEELILEIQKVFTKIRTALNEREDELLSKVKEIYESSFFDEEIVKESEKLPIKVKQSLDSINKIKEIKDKENELSSEINYYIEFENNLNKIDELNKSIIKCNTNKSKIIFEFIKDEIENNIKIFGNIKNAVYIEFEEKNIEKIIDIKYSKFFTIQNIKIMNIGHKLYKNLCLVKDKVNSSKEINFFEPNNPNGINELIIKGDFEPKKPDNFNVSLCIRNPKPNQIYKMIIYVREKIEGYNLSEPFEIIVKVYGDEVNELYPELEDEHGISGLKKKKLLKKKFWN